MSSSYPRISDQENRHWDTICLGIMTLATVIIVGMFGLLSLGASLTPETEPFRLAIAFPSITALFFYLWCLLLGIAAIRERSRDRQRKLSKCDNLFVVFFFTTIVVAMVAAFAIMLPFRGEAAPSDDAHLSSLEFSSIVLTPTFSAEETRYRGVASFLSRNTDVQAIPRAEGATVRFIVGGQEHQAFAIPVDPREFTILIIVTAPDRTTQRVYEVNVTR